MCSSDTALPHLAVSPFSSVARGCGLLPFSSCTGNEYCCIRMLLSCWCERSSVCVVLFSFSKTCIWFTLKGFSVIFKHFTSWKYVACIWYFLFWCENRNNHTHKPWFSIILLFSNTFITYGKKTVYKILTSSCSLYFIQQWTLQL